MAGKKRYQTAKRYVVLCSNCNRQFTIRTRGGGIDAVCPHCGHRERRG